MRMQGRLDETHNMQCMHNACTDFNMCGKPRWKPCQNVTETLPESNGHLVGNLAEHIKQRQLFSEEFLLFQRA